MSYKNNFEKEYQAHRGLCVARGGTPLTKETFLLNIKKNSKDYTPEPKQNNREKRWR